MIGRPHHFISGSFGSWLLVPLLAWFGQLAVPVKCLTAVAKSDGPENSRQGALMRKEQSTDEKSHDAMEVGSDSSVRSAEAVQTEVAASFSEGDSRSSAEEDVHWRRVLVEIPARETTKSVLDRSPGQQFPSAPSPGMSLLQRSPGPPGVELIDSQRTDPAHPLIMEWREEDNIANDANTFTKLSGAAEYDGESCTRHNNVMSMKARALQTDKNIRMGLSQTQWETHEFTNGVFIGFYDDGRLYIPDFDVNSNSGVVTYTTEDEYGLVVENNFVHVYHGDSKIHTFSNFAVGTSGCYAAIFIKDVGARIQVTEMAISQNIGGVDTTVVLANEGPAGPPGAEGPVGPPGAPGPQGAAGPAWQAPASGVYEPAPPGPPGPNGPPGPPGVEGPAGPEGPQGLIGEAGATGQIPQHEVTAWNAELQLLDEAIKRAADMDRQERLRLAARMTQVETHLGTVESKLLLAEQAQLAAQEKAEKGDRKSVV